MNVGLYWSDFQIKRGELSVKSKGEFVDMIQEIRDLPASWAEAKRPCPNLKCEWHGDCYNRVRIHRYFEEHVPKCMQFILRDKVKELAQLVEYSVENITGSPGRGCFK